MPDPELVQRVEKLEQTVDSLRDLPERTTRLEVRMGNVETQIVQLRTEMRDEFSAVRQEMAEMKTELRGDIRALGTELRGEMVNLGEHLRKDIADLGRDMAAQMLDMSAQVLELGNQSRVQYEAPNRNCHCTGRKSACKLGNLASAEFPPGRTEVRPTYRGSP